MLLSALCSRVINKAVTQICHTWYYGRNVKSFYHGSLIFLALARFRVVGLCWFWLILLGCEVYNLGTGKGTSVLEMVAAFEKASGKVVFLLHSSIILISLCPPLRAHILILVEDNAHSLVFFEFSLPGMICHLILWVGSMFLQKTQMGIMLLPFSLNGGGKRNSQFS